MQKLYCYVDETGQDTEGDFFLVSVVVTESERDDLKKELEAIEKKSGKGLRKWRKARVEHRKNYIREILKIPALQGKLKYATYHQTTDYLTSTILTTARAITTEVRGDYKATVFVDGLPRSMVRWFSKELRHLKIRIRKVRGVKREETDCLMRLADALAGFARSATSGDKAMHALLLKAKSRGYIREL